MSTFCENPKVKPFRSIDFISVYFRSSNESVVCFKSRFESYPVINSVWNKDHRT